MQEVVVINNQYKYQATIIGEEQKGRRNRKKDKDRHTHHNIFTHKLLHDKPHNNRRQRGRKEVRCN